MSGKTAEMGDEELLRSLQIDDSYHVERVLAKGEGGRTELVSGPDGGLFVRKRMPLPLANRGVWERLAGERGPRLPRVIATYELPDEFVAVCTWIEGVPLPDLVEERGAFHPVEAASLVGELAEALSWLHERGIVHRDVSPSNVVMAADGAHLIDFGIARLRSDDATHDTTLLGTWGFAAPEQYGFAQTDARSDVYALGRLLAYLVCGELPGTPAFDERLADADVVPPELRAVIDRACAFEPSVRYRSVLGLARAAREAAAKAPVKVEQVEPAGEGASFPQRLPRLRRLLVGIIALVQLLVVIIFGGATIQLIGAPTSVSDPLSGVLCAAAGLFAVVCLGVEPCRALLGRGPYAKPPVLRTLLKRVLVGFAWLVLLFVILVTARIFMNL